MKPLIVALFFLVLLAPSVLPAAPAVPSGLRAETDKGVTLHWNESAGASGYRVYRAKADVEDTFGKVGESRTPHWTDNKAVPGRSYMYYVVAVSARSVSDNSEIVTATAGGGMGRTRGDGTREKTPRPRRTAAADGERFDIVVSGTTMVAFHYQPSSGQVQFTNTAAGPWHRWKPMGTLPPPRVAGSDAVISFAADPKRTMAWCWDPASRTAWFSTFDFGRMQFNEWVRFQSELPAPPNMNAGAQLMFDTTELKTFVAAYSPADGRVYITRNEGNTWSSWVDFGSIEKPSNHSSTVQYSIGVRVMNGKGDWALVAYDPQTNRMMQSIRASEHISWTSWQSADQIFGTP